MVVMIAKIERMREEDRVNNDNHENERVKGLVVAKGDIKG